MIQWIILVGRGEVEGNRLIFERSILGILVGDPSYIHGTVQCTSFQGGGSFHP